MGFHVDLTSFYTCYPSIHPLYKYNLVIKDGMILNSYNVSFDDIHQFTPYISIINGLPRRPSIILHFVNIYLSTVFMNPSYKLSLAVNIWKIVWKY